VIDGKADVVPHNKYCLEVRSDGKLLTTFKRFCSEEDESHEVKKKVNSIGK
jgi:hypothetical protein